MIIWIVLDTLGGGFQTPKNLAVVVGAENLSLIIDLVTAGAIWGAGNLS